MNWTLILMAVSTLDTTTVQSVDRNIITGFETKEECEFAAQAIGYRTIDLYFEATKNIKHSMKHPKGLATSHACVNLEKPEKTPTGEIKEVTEACSYWHSKYSREQNKENAKMLMLMCTEQREGKMTIGNHDGTTETYDFD